MSLIQVVSLTRGEGLWFGRDSLVEVHDFHSGEIVAEAFGHGKAVTAVALSLTLSLSHTHSQTHTLSLSHTHTLSLSLSLSHTHTHKRKQARSWRKRSGTYYALGVRGPSSASVGLTGRFLTGRRWVCTTHHLVSLSLRRKDP